MFEEKKKKRHVWNTIKKETNGKSPAEKQNIDLMADYTANERLSELKYKLHPEWSLGREGGQRDENERVRLLLNHRSYGDKV